MLMIKTTTNKNKTPNLITFLTTCIVLLLIIFGITLTAADICHSADWHHYVLDDCWGNTALKMDSQDLPCILYDVSGGLRIAHYTGTEWEYEDIYGTDYGGGISMVLDSQDYPHISYHDWNYDDLMYCYWNGSQWVIELVDDEDDSGMHNSITIDSNGYPHIAYRHHILDDSKDLRYSYKDNDGWHIEVVDDEFQFQGDYCSIALDSQDRPHIAYRKRIGKGDYLGYAHWDGSQWLLETITEIAYFSNNTSIAADSQDHPHIAFVNGSNVAYAYSDGAEWVIEELDDYSGEVSLALDSQEYPHIAYCNGDLGISYASWNGSEWEIEVAWSDESFWLGQLSVSLDLDSNDNPHISCDEWDYATVWYIWFGDPLTGITLEQFSAHAEGSAIALNWSVQTTEDEQIAGFNLYRRELPGEASSLGDIAHHTIKDDWIKINPSPITGENPYSYTDSSVESSVAYEYKLEAVLYSGAETLGTTQVTAGLPPASFAILALYPNPASDELTCLLALPSAGVVELRLYDISGRLVLVQHLEPTEPAELEAVLDVSSMASGVYTLRASYDGAEASARAVVVK